MLLVRGNPGYFYGSCYKYRNFENLSHLEDLIVNRMMMFASPATFNDPYDCRPTYTREGDPGAARKHVGAAWEEARKRKGAGKPTKKEYSRHISKVMSEINTPEGAGEHFEGLLHRRTGAFCMSESWQLLTQWAYYAANGSGLCLEFDVQPGGGFDRVFGITYSNMRPKLDIVRMLYDQEYQRDAMFQAITHKAEAWSHERELRALHMEPGLHPYAEGMLTSIMVGQSASAANIEWLLNLLEANGIGIPVFQVGLCPETFDLQRHPI
jgi:hypothetical protein